MYVKGETLCALHEAQEAIGKAGYAWVVEGQVDAVRMHLAGLGTRKKITIPSTDRDEGHWGIVDARDEAFGGRPDHTSMSTNHGSNLGRRWTIDSY